MISERVSVRAEPRRAFWRRLISNAAYLVQGIMLSLVVAVVINAVVAAVAAVLRQVNPDVSFRWLIALPTGLVYGFGGPRRSRIAAALMLVIGVLILTFVACGYNQDDPAYDVALTALVALAIPMVGAHALPRAVQDRGRGTGKLWRLAPGAGRATVRAIRRLTAYHWVPSAKLVRRLAIGIAALAALAAAGSVIAALAASGFDLASTHERVALVHLCALLVDAAAGGLAMWFVGRRLGGPGAALGAAVLWMCCGVRLDYGSLGTALPAPTAVVPLLTLVSLELRERGLLRKQWLALVLAIAIVPLTLNWPLLAVTASLAVTFAFWSIDRSDEARWGLLPLGLSLVCMCLASSRVGAELNAQTAIFDPLQRATACTTGCDGALPWEFFYPSAYGGAYAGLLTGMLSATLHWGDYRLYSIAPGWAELALAALGAVAAWQAGLVKRVKVWLVAIALGIVLALPSHYLGLVLPSLARLIVAAAPAFEFAAQLALLSGFFVAVLGGIGLRVLLGRNSRDVAVVPALAVAVLLLLDFGSLPASVHAASALAQVGAGVAPSGTPPKVAFYPFISRGYGPEYDALVSQAQRLHIELVNAEDPADPSLADLSAPATARRLESMGTQYVVVSLNDYVRRREMLREAHLLLPADQYQSSAAWLVPEPASLLALRLERTATDGTMLLHL